MRNRVEVLREVCVDHVSVPLAEAAVHFSHRVVGTLSRPVPVGVRLEVRLKDRLQHKLGGGLHHSVPNRRDTQRPLATTRLWNHHPAYRACSIRLLAQLLSEPSQPLPHAPRLDVRKSLPVHARRSTVGTAQPPRVFEDVLAPHLVVEQVEAVVGLPLRLLVKLPPKTPDLLGRLQAHYANLPVLVFIRSTPEVRPLPSTGVDRLLQYCGPLRLPARLHAAHCGVEGRDSPASPGLPRCACHPSPRATPTTPVDHDGCACRLLPHHAAAFPVTQAGRRPRLPFRGLLRIHSRCGPRVCSKGLLPSFVPEASSGWIAPTRRSGSYRGVPTTPLAELSSAGHQRLRGALNPMG